MLHDFEELEILFNEQLSNFSLAAQPFLVGVTIPLGCHPVYFASCKQLFVQKRKMRNSPGGGGETKKKNEQNLLTICSSKDGNCKAIMMSFNVST